MVGSPQNFDFTLASLKINNVSVTEQELVSLIGALGVKLLHHRNK